MIPHPIAALKSLTVLVTRPAEQADKLSALIEAKGGQAIRFPAVVIEPIEATPNGETFDWLIFTSVNAVKFGLQRITLDKRTRIAAIGVATAAALRAAGLNVDATPESNATSEGLLAHAAFASIAQQRVLIVKGEDGRELLPAALGERGAQVVTLDVYRRVRPTPEAQRLAALQQHWRDEGIDVVTLTSVDVLTNLLALLDDETRRRLQVTPFVAASKRVTDAARAQGLTGDAIESSGAGDESIVGAIAAWHARAR